MNSKDLRVERLSHLVWLLTEVLHIGAVMRSEGKCLGNLRLRHLEVAGQQLRRARSTPLDTARDWLASRRHEAALWPRVSHDIGCGVLGVSQRTLLGLAKACDGVHGRLLVEEAIVRGVHDAVTGAEGRIIAFEQWRSVHAEVAAEKLIIDELAAVVKPRPPHDTAEPRQSKLPGLREAKLGRS
ncbi:hypothetical protein [Leucobacter chinensis]|uniref:hypothetical protein n=1 Tax=Leucobacter chinensis TaxID=2851010 RepID=UPI001C21E945|nr:hypothetical protein [Leucobacter chinensis]